MIKLDQREKDLITRVLGYRKDEIWAVRMGELMAEMTYNKILLSRYDLAVILGFIKDYCRDHEAASKPFWELHNKLEEILLLD